MSSLAERLRKFLDTEEGKKSLEEFGKKLEREAEFKDRWTERFKDHSEDNLDFVLEKLICKYDSDEYVRKEYSKGYEPREELLWVAFNYAEKYCKECTDEKYLNMFTGEAYYIGSYVIQVMNGQGSVIKIEKVETL
jgi:hypothetical protein